ncbi:MAG: tetratricopeptide repeat protein, partial [Acidimicrobiales bacterium]
FHPDPNAAVNPSVMALLLVLDDALAAYQAGDPEPLLRQPPAISNLLERQLDRDTASLRRLELARLGFAGGDAADWIHRLERLCSELTGLAQAEATALLALHYVRQSSLGPADVLLDQVVEAASAEVAPLLLWTGEQLLEARHPARARAILEAGRPHTPADGQLRLAIALDAACQRSGHFRDVVSVWEHTGNALLSLVGPDHPDSLATHNYLALAYESAGDLGRATAMFEATLADRERVLGPGHADTLAARNNLAFAYQSAGDLGRAIPMHEATLADFERVLGPDHPHTLTSRNNLASAFASAGDLGRAIPMHEATLADCERVLGPDHPDTLTSRNNLARAYKSAGVTPP